MPRPVDCAELGVSVKFGQATCYDDGTIAVSGPAVLWAPSLRLGLDGRARRVGPLQGAILDLVARGLHARGELASALGASPDTVSYSLRSLVRKGLLVAVRATDGGPCRTLYFLPGQPWAEELRERGMRPCRAAR